MKVKYFSTVAFLAAFFILQISSLAQKAPLPDEKFEKINTQNIQIVRDQWGVPHIYGKTDAEVAYGLAWANAEDDFSTMQELLLAGIGRAGKYMGKEGAVRDFLSNALGSKELAISKYETDLSPQFKKYLNGYVQGINAYAATHPKEVKVKGTFPITSFDMIKSYVFALSVVSGVAGSVSSIVDGKFDKLDVPMGSNSFAFNSNKTTDGSQILVINPHQPVEGPFSWYEAHLCSEEGLNILGAMFPGGTTIFLGANENLGWAHTYNRMDLVDVFKLEMHPDKKLTYKFDGEWHELKKKKARLKVKIKKWLPAITVKKDIYESKYGTTLESKNGNFYSVRFWANTDIRGVEQMYWMNKASNFEEFQKAIHMHATPRYNIMYADKDDNIFYLNYAKVPKRDTTERYNWKKVVPGNTSKTLWTEYHPLDFMPQNLNPECGYLFNCNNSPFNSSCPSDNKLDPNDYPYYMGFEPGENNRSERFMEMIPHYHKVSYEDVKDIKFDKHYPQTSTFIESVNKYTYGKVSENPDIIESVKMMREWDREADIESEGAAVYLLTFQYVFDKMGFSDRMFMSGVKIEEPLYVEAVKYAQEHIKKYFNKDKVKLGDVQRHVRGNVEYPIGGFPDMLAANYNKPYKDGKFQPYVGDSYVEIVQYKDGKLERLETLHPFGASARPNSPHYTDQMKLYAEQETKVMTLDKEEIFKNAERIYHPE